MAVWSSVRIREVASEDRLDTEFFTPKNLARARMLKREHAVALGQDCTVLNGKTPSHYEEDGEFSVVRSGDLANPLVYFDSGHNFLQTNVAIKGATLRKGDVLISSIGVGSIGKIGVVIDPRKLVTVSEVTIVRSAVYTPEFLFAYFATEAGQGEINRRVTGATGQQHLIKSNAEAILIPPPPPKVVSMELARLVADAHAEQSGAHELIVEAESLLMEALRLERLDPMPSPYYDRSFSDLLAEGRFDAEYFNPKYQRVIEALQAGGRTLGGVAPLAERPFIAARRPEGSNFRYIEIGSLTGDGESEAEALDVADAPSRATWIVKPGDVITSTVRPIRRLSAVVRDDQDGCVCSSGFAVLSPKSGPDGIEPEVLLTYLRLPIVCELLDLHTTATMYPAIPTDRLMRFPIVVPDQVTRAAVVQKVNATIAARRRATELLEKTKQMVEDLIANGGSAS
ncbi:MAG: restriction endonuclease subunit S [Gammaproteobacteria bacterium]